MIGDFPLMFSGYDEEGLAVFLFCGPMPKTGKTISSRN